MHSSMYWISRALFKLTGLKFSPSSPPKRPKPRRFQTIASHKLKTTIVTASPFFSGFRAIILPPQYQTTISAVPPVPPTAAPLTATPPWYHIHQSPRLLNMQNASPTSFPKSQSETPQNSTQNSPKTAT